MTLYVGPQRLPDNGIVIFRGGDDVAFIDMRNGEITVEFEPREIYTLAELEFIMQTMREEQEGPL